MKSKANIIVAGKIIVVDGKREEFLNRSRDLIEKARATGDCIDFSVSADSIEPNRVNIFEAWVSTNALQNFRGEGPDDGLSQLIEGAEVAEYEVSVG